MIPPLLRMKYAARQNSIRGGLIINNCMHQTKLEQWREQKLPEGERPALLLKYVTNRTASKGGLYVVGRSVEKLPYDEGTYSHHLVVSDGRRGVATFGVLARSCRMNLLKGNLWFMQSLKEWIKYPSS